MTRGDTWRLLRWRRRDEGFRDLWFRSECSLPEIADRLELTQRIHDHENYWEWIIGRFGGLWRGEKIDLTRTHRHPALEVDTRIFLLRRHPFGVELARRLAERLHPIAVGSIKCGRWIYRRGNEFEKRVECELQP